MGILVRYLLREYLKIFGLCLTGLFTVYFAVDFFEKVRRFARYDASASSMVSYFILRIPQMIMDILPLAVLMAVVLTLGILSRHNEITAMKGCGVSPARMALPFLVISLLISTVLLMVNLSIVPLLKRQTEYVRHVQIKKRPPDIYFRQSRIWLRTGPHTYMNIQLADSQKSTLFGVNLYKLREDFSMTEFIEAKRIRYEEGQWILYDGIRRVFLPDGRIEVQHLDRAVISLNRKPEEFVRIEKDTDKMTARELAEYVTLLKQEGHGAERYRVDLHTKMALPFISFVLALIGVPLGLGRGLGQGISRGIGLCLIMAAAYWIVLSLCISLGYGHVLHPFVAAWLPNGLFALTGLFLMMRVSQQ